ncbi:YwqG family protein [uncultured Fusobacterium sp.]|uniref:YwqG family protein n=1 Tax=uncultured Fusobacterium sp. TaxID=159267 RepID=UPI00265DECA5|nr:YwqG family protein [uncultured Fusobacterium sp.]
MLDKNMLETSKKNAILINYSEDENKEKLPKGTSKIGGKPDLPKDFQWFYYKGEDYKKIVENRPLSFLMQINCEEVHKYDKESLLPEKGMLYFFYELFTMTWGFSPQDRGSAKVFYYDGEIEALVPVDFPEDMEKDCIIPESKINFESMNDYPIDFLDYYDPDDSDEEMERKEKEFEKELEELGYKTDTTKLLGHPELIQGEYWEECEGVARKNIYYGSAPIKYGSDEVKKSIKENAKDWILLMQMSELEIGDYGLYFGDSGKIYFNIRKEDLKNKNFDNVWLTLQCY